MNSKEVRFFIYIIILTNWLYSFQTFYLFARLLGEIYLSCHDNVNIVVLFFSLIHSETSFTQPISFFILFC